MEMLTNDVNLELEQVEECSDASNSSWEDVDDDDDIPDNLVCTTPSLLMNNLILEKIFEFLPTKNLLECRLVSKEWNRTALLKRCLGSKVEIRITKTNFERFLKISQNSPLPFCRKFEFQSVELDVDKVSKFIKIFGERINSLSIKFCTASSVQSVVTVLKCPRLEELIIYGELPELKDEDFNSCYHPRLKVLSLYASFEYGNISVKVIDLLLRRSPNLHIIKLGRSITLWNNICFVMNISTTPKICEIEMHGIETPLEATHFAEECLPNTLTLQKLSLYNCLVSQHFFEQFCSQNCRVLTELHIVGTQQEILTKAFSGTILPNLHRLSLPLDGIGFAEGHYIIKACPNLKTLKVSGIFETLFSFQGESLLSVIMKENCRSTFLSPVVIYGKRREFLKLLSILQLQPDKLEINLPKSYISNRCLRAVYLKYPDLKYLCIVHSSVRECIVGLTGIPYRVYRKIAHCKSFAVLSPNEICKLPALSTLKQLKGLKLSLTDDGLNKELTLLLLVYGISQVCNLDALSLNGVKVTDVAMMTLAQRLNLSIFLIDGSDLQWKQFKTNYEQHKIKSFLLPPPSEAHIMAQRKPEEIVGMEAQFVLKIFNYLNCTDIFKARNVCKYWHVLSNKYLHRRCKKGDLIEHLEERVKCFEKSEKCHHSQNSIHYPAYYKKIPVSNLTKLLQLWDTANKETTLAIVSLERSTLEYFQLDNNQLNLHKHDFACQQRKTLEYWYYPDGNDELISHPNYEQNSLKDALSDSALEDITTLLTIGCWARKDDGLLRFFNPKWTITTIYLIGLQKDSLDIILPKLTQVIHLESLCVRPLASKSTYYELTKTHLQILCNAAFHLKNLIMKVLAPSEAIIEFVKSQRFTLETLELHSPLNISDRLTFAMPQLQILNLDEPPGCLFWKTLNIHSNLKTINCGRSCTSINQVKNKSTSKMSTLDSEFEHSATEILCDVNWFLENTVYKPKCGTQKSILQQGSDSALRFFTHFPFLSSLVLKGVHAHYGILQGIFKKFPLLKKLELISATGVTDEILTGFSKEILNDMDIMNPFHQVKSRRNASEVQGKVKGTPSIRNLKCLTHLVLDDQPLSDFSVIFSLLKLRQLEFLSCKKWKLSDISIRALADTLPSLKNIDASGCSTVSKYALRYFKESRLKYKQTFDTE